MPDLQIDVAGGMAGPPNSSPGVSSYRTEGGHLAFAVSKVVERGAVDLSAGVHAVLVFAQTVYSEGGESPYSGLVGGAHLGAARNIGTGHQIGARVGYSPVVIEGETLIYLNSVNTLYFKYGF